MELRVGTSVLGPDGQRYRVARIDKGFDPNQPRDDHGRWTSVGGSLGGNIPAFLSMVADTQGGRPSVDKFVLEHGRGYPTDAGSYVGGEVHLCYKNASLAVIADDSLTYVEGYIDVHGVPIQHAWTVNKSGVVRDVTLRDGKGIRGYFGVPIKTRYMERAILDAGVYGVLTHNQTQRLSAADPREVIQR